MQKGVFTTWIKELCALVFVQTIQAFILAIVLSIMLTFLLPYKTEDGKAAITSQDTVSALGVLCIVLLTSLTKMEQITKKIFGLDSSLLSNKPPHGFMTSYLALKAAGKALNNIPKVASGVGKIVGGGLDRTKAKNANLTRLKRAGLDTNGNAMTGGVNPDDSLLQERKNLLSQRRRGESENDEEYKQRRDDIRNQLNENTRKMAAQYAMNAKSGKNTIPTKSVPKDASKDYWKIMDKYDDELAKAKAKQKEGIKEALSGLSETVGAGIGAMGGAAVGLSSGLASGDLDQIPKAIGFGVGAGDQVGKSIVDAGDAVNQGIKKINSNIKASNELNDNLAKMEKNLQIQKKGKMKAAARFKDVQKAIRENNNISDL